MPIWRWRAGDGQEADCQDSVAEPCCVLQQPLRPLLPPGLSPPPHPNTMPSPRCAELCGSEQRQHLVLFLVGDGGVSGADGHPGSAR
eukprot:1909664-Rhodomonas_salina.1